MYLKVLFVVSNLVCFLSCTSNKITGLSQQDEAIEGAGSNPKQIFKDAACESIQLPKDVFSVEDVQFVTGSSKDIIMTAKLRNSTAKIFALEVEDNLKTSINDSVASVQESKLRAIFSKKSGDQTLMLVYMNENGVPIAQWHSVSDSGPSKIASITLPSEVVEHDVQSFESKVFVTLRHSVYESTFLVLDLMDTKNQLRKVNYVSQSRSSKFVGSSRGKTGFVVEKISEKDTDAFKLTSISLDTLEVTDSRKVFLKSDSAAIESVDYSAMADSAIVVASVGDSMIGEASIAAARIDLSNQVNEVNWSNKIQYKDSHLSEIRLFHYKQGFRAFVFDWVSEQPKLSSFKFDQSELVKHASWKGFYSGSAIIDATRLTDAWLLVIRAKRGENYIHQICKVNER